MADKLKLTVASTVIASPFHYLSICNMISSTQTGRVKEKPHKNRDDMQQTYSLAEKKNKDNKLTSSQWPPVTKALSCSGGVLPLIPPALDAADTGLLFCGGDGQALSRQESYWRQVRPGEMTP